MKQKDTIIGVVIEPYFCIDCEIPFDCYFNYYNHRKLVHVDFTNQNPISIVELK